MAERRRNRRKQDGDQVAMDEDKPQKVECEVAKYLRSHLPQKQTTLHSHKVDYFIGSRAVDLLLTSGWARADKKTDQVLFPNRAAVVDFLDTMLRHQFFHRAKAIIVTKEVKIKDAGDTGDEAKKSEKSSKSKSKGSEAEKTPEAKKSPRPKKEKVEKKKKVKLGMHDVQMFVDENEPFVWLYDYIPFRTWLIGGCLLLAAIAFCLFPLWPRSVRTGVYYVSIAAASFLFFIIGLAVLKLAMFALVWLVTFGRHHFWILPNLTEDVGFLESFWPLYKHECHNPANAAIDNGAGDDGDDGKEDEDGIEQERKSDSEADSVANTENGHNGFEILDSNDCNEDDTA